MSKKPEIDSIDIACEFLEIAFHNILYIRKLYPDEIFQTKRKYGVIIHKSIHPEVNEYISNCIKAIHFHLKRHQIPSIYFVVFDSKSRVLERFSFDVVSIKKSFDTDPFLLKLETNFQEFYLKLNNSLNYLANVPEDAHFEILINVTEYSSLEIIQDPQFNHFPWINAPEKDYSIGAPEILPLHTVDSDVFKLQIFVERRSTDEHN